MSLRTGILGGTFDPVHNAHLAVASAALRALALERILWLPTGTPPYRAAPVAAAVHRVAMLKLAIEGEPRYAIDERELRPGASGFTFDSISSLKSENPRHDFLLIMGADQYAKRSTWHRWAELEKLCAIAVVARPGSKADATAPTIAMTPSPVSASDIRARVARGEEIAALVPPAVAAYIREKGLYR
ncbi:MAG TPA: nicotinate (nicotinamide) nucleotide adenylyltransferase [Burkholderiales bacterium]